MNIDGVDISLDNIGQDLLELVVGERWPNGDEGAMRSLASAWNDAATQLDAVRQRATAAANAAAESCQGANGSTFSSFWSSNFDDGKTSWPSGTAPAALPFAVQFCKSMAQALNSGATQIETTKDTIMGNIAILVATVAPQIAAGFFDFGATDATAIAEVAADRTAMQVFLDGAKELIVEVVKQAIEQGLQQAELNFVIQLKEVAEGHASSIDWKQVGSSGLSGAEGGALGTAFGFGLGKLGGKVIGEDFGKSFTSRAVTGVASGALTNASMDLLQNGTISASDFTKGSVAGVLGGIHGSEAAAGDHPAIDTTDLPTELRTPETPTLDTSTAAPTVDTSLGTDLSGLTLSPDRGATTGTGTTGADLTGTGSGGGGSVDVSGGAQVDPSQGYAATSSIARILGGGTQDAGISDAGASSGSSYGSSAGSDVGGDVGSSVGGSSGLGSSIGDVSTGGGITQDSSLGGSSGSGSSFSGGSSAGYEAAPVASARADVSSGGSSSGGSVSSAFDTGGSVGGVGGVGDRSGSSSYTPTDTSSYTPAGGSADLASSGHASAAEYAPSETAGTGSITDAPAQTSGQISSSYAPVDNGASASGYDGGGRLDAAPTAEPGLESGGSGGLGGGLPLGGAASEAVPAGAGSGYGRGAGIDDTSGTGSGSGIGTDAGAGTSAGYERGAAIDDPARSGLTGAGAGTGVDGTGRAVSSSRFYGGRDSSFTGSDDSGLGTSRDAGVGLGRETVPDDFANTTPREVAAPATEAAGFDTAQGDRVSSDAPIAADPGLAADPDAATDAAATDAQTGNARTADGLAPDTAVAPDQATARPDATQNPATPVGDTRPSNTEPRPSSAETPAGRGDTPSARTDQTPSQAPNQAPDHAPGQASDHAADQSSAPVPDRAGDNLITAASVPGSGFRGHAEAPTASHIGEVRAAIDPAVRDVVDAHPGLSVEALPQEGLYRITDDSGLLPDGQRTFTVRVETQRLGDETAARSILNHDKGQHVIQLSDQISQNHVPRAVAHEIGEIVADRQRYLVDKVDAFAPDESNLRPGGPTEDVRLTPHDAGRVQELRVLGQQLDKLPPEGSRSAEQQAQYEGTHREAMALVEHLGLREGTPGAEQRRALALDPQRLTAEGQTHVNRLLDDAGRSTESLSATDQQALQDIHARAQTDQAAFDAHRAGLRPDFQPPIAQDGGRVAPEQFKAIADAATARREDRSGQTLADLHQQAAELPEGEYPKVTLQAGGGAALAARDPHALLVDDRGRWQADNGDRIAQTADQLRNLRQTGLGDPYQFVGEHDPGARVPLDAVRYWEDDIAAQGPVVNGTANFRMENGKMLADITPEHGDPITVEVEGTPVISSGFPPEIIPGIDRSISGGMHGTYEATSRALETLGTPEARAAKVEFDKLSWRDEASAGKAVDILRESGVDRAGLPDAVNKSLDAVANWKSLRDTHEGQILSGDDANLRGVDPTAAKDWIVAGTGGTGISGVENMLKLDPDSHYTMIGRSAPPGLADNTQWKEVRTEHDQGFNPKQPLDPSLTDPATGQPFNPGATGRLTMAFDRDMNITGIEPSTAADGSTRFSVAGFEGDGVIASLGTRAAVPPSVAEMVDSALKSDPKSVTGKMLFDDDGQYLGYRIDIAGKSIDVTGAASRFFPVDQLFSQPRGGSDPLPASGGATAPGTVWSTGDARYAAAPSERGKFPEQTGSNRDAPPEGGNFDGGYVATATQAMHYAAMRRRGATPTPIPPPPAPPTTS
ncbi:hypothetical protein KDL01_04585 [Actinospica durhamensis]|uniref:Outer membrane channel protein CpnT-like N-terminal domain-containing protein n=1 Tax=Actinospica durhamensis TaxID=1508375 RepID=A0A941EJT8_9ACTN|nr:hypothetical protein [Actinospica durhamensis]MBR7832521.1 hypothetical protein [Actinospica durhamensis]